MARKSMGRQLWQTGSRKGGRGAAAVCVCVAVGGAVCGVVALDVDPAMDWWRVLSSAFRADP